jgi:hypothetical protein
MLSGEVAEFQKRWAERVAQEPLAKRVLAELWTHREAHIRPILDFARSQNPIIDPIIQSEPVEMTQHVADHFSALLALPTEHGERRGWSADTTPLDFVVRHGVRRARAGVPLRAVLQAYRSGHRSFWTIMCAEIDRLSPDSPAGMRATMLLSDYCIDYTDMISLVLTDAYVAESGRLESDRARLTSAVVDDLLRGHLPERDEARQLCAHNGLGDGNAMVVVLARPAVSQASGMLAQHRELAALLDRVLPTDQFGRLIEARADDVVAVISGGAHPGARVAEALRGDARAVLRSWLDIGRIGLGLEVSTIAELPRALVEATVALELRGDHPPIRHLQEIDVQAYFRHTADQTARRLLPALTDEVTAPPLADTLAAFAAANLNVKACARAQGVHTNTIYYRLNRVQKLTGLDPRSFAALAALLTAMQVRDGGRG